MDEITELNDDIGFFAALEYAERSYDADADAYGSTEE